jgi:hypothetical protein
MCQRRYGDGSMCCSSTRIGYFVADVKEWRCVCRAVTFVRWLGWLSHDGVGVADVLE